MSYIHGRLYAIHQSTSRGTPPDYAYIKSSILETRFGTQVQMLPLRGPTIGFHLEKIRCICTRILE
jgi:hypothetical protein